MNLLALGIRNLTRHRTRSLVTIGAMAFAGIIMIVYIGLMEGIFESSRRNAVDYDLGEFKINAPNYRKDPDLYKRIANADALLSRCNGPAITPAHDCTALDCSRWVTHQQVCSYAVSILIERRW